MAGKKMIHLISKFMQAYRHKGKSFHDSILYAYDVAGAAIFATTIILSAGFALLATSAFKPNTDMGLVTGIAILLAMFINFLVLPTLLSFLINKHKGQIS